MAPRRQGAAPAAGAPEAAGAHGASHPMGVPKLKPPCGMPAAPPASGTCCPNRYVPCGAARGC